MYQQLYLMGRDVLSRHGNLLTQYGVQRIESPYEGVPSLYQVILTTRSRIAFRGFGIFVGDDRKGGVFIDRFQTIPYWTPKARFTPIAWRPEDLPKLRKPRSLVDLQRANELFQLLMNWCIGYETWIRNEFGRRYRASQLCHFRRQGNASIYWDSVAIWQHALELIQS
jgi:hypothetical protein